MCYWSSSHLPKFRLSATYSEFSTSWSEWVPSPSRADCLWLSGQPVFNQVVWKGQAWVRARAPPSAVFLPLALARGKLLQNRLLERAWRRQSPSQRRGGQLVVTFSPTQLRQSISFVPWPLLPTAVFKQQCWDPPGSLQRPPRPSGHSGPECGSIPDPTLFSHCHVNNHSLSTMNLNCLFPPNLDCRTPPGLPAKSKCSAEHSRPSRTLFPGWGGAQPQFLTHVGVSLRSLLTPSSQPQSPSPQPCSAFQVKMMSTYSLDLNNSWVQMRASHHGFQSTLLTLLSLIYSPYDKLYVEKGFVNCVCPKYKTLFLPYNLSSSPLSHFPPSTHQTVGAQ